MRDGLSRGEDESVSDREYGSPALAGLLLATVLLSLLPIPVIALALLPAYTTHAWFLIFYAPLVCFLVLGYLLYVREGLARMMFAGLREKVADPDPIYSDPMSVRARMLARRLLAVVFNVLPAILLGASLYCVSRYVARFNDSVAIASGVLAGRIPPPVPIDSAAGTRGPGAKDSAGAQPPAGAPGSATDPSPEMAALRQLPSLATDPNPLRTYTLKTAMIDDIPHFAELTAFYIGGIACALAAVLLVLIKEYARSALGVSEEKLLRGTVEEPLAADVEGVEASRRWG